MLSPLRPYALTPTVTQSHFSAKYQVNDSFGRPSGPSGTGPNGDLLVGRALQGLRNTPDAESVDFTGTACKPKNLGQNAIPVVLSEEVEESEEVDS